MSIEYEHFKDFPSDEWRWPNFTPREMRSKSDNKLMIDEHSMDCLQRLRTRLGYPLSVNSAYRSPAHNKKVGGAPKSQHLKAKAFDIPQRSGRDPAAFEAAARAVGFTSFGFYPVTAKRKVPFIHIDTRDFGRTWGGRWWTGTAPAPSIPTKRPKPDPTPSISSLVARLLAILISIFKGRRK